MFQRIDYNMMDSRQKEIYNYQKVSGVLAEYGYSTHRLSSDWNGADFLAIHFDGKRFLKVQLKGRLTFDKKYRDKDLWICFRGRDCIYVYPHDIVLIEALRKTNIEHTHSWNNWGGYSFPSIPKSLKDDLNLYCLAYDK